LSPAKVISFWEGKLELDNSCHEGICRRFEYFRRQARLYARNRFYSDAVVWHEKAFEFGLQHKDHIERKDIHNAAWVAVEFAFDLTRGDRNFWTPIWIARKCIDHLHADEWDTHQSVCLAWLIIREYKQFLGMMPLDAKAALYMLEHKTKQYPTFGYEGQTPLLP